MAPLRLDTILKLNDGRTIPQLGLGVYQSRGAGGKAAIAEAIRVGYRHIDTAQFYHNEEEVGSAVREEKYAKREDVFVTTKIWDSSHGYDEALRSLDQSLSTSGLSYFDLVLIHSPNPGSKKRLETYRALIDARKQGLTRSIGVSNYGPHHLAEIDATFPNDPPAINQVELSPFFQRHEIVEACQKRNILVQAYSPLGKGAFVELPQLQKIAEKYNKKPPHILIRWSLQRGFVCLPKSSNSERLKANADVFDFELSDDDMAQLNAMETGSGITWNPTLVK